MLIMYGGNAGDASVRQVGQPTGADHVIEAERIFFNYTARAQTPALHGTYTQTPHVHMHRHRYSEHRPTASCKSGRERE